MKKVFLFFAAIGVVLFSSASSFITAYRSQFTKTNSKVENCCEDNDSVFGARHIASNNDAVVLSESSGAQLSGQMVWIPGGDFWMGDVDKNFPDSQPVHRVRVDGFWMDQFAVTNEEFLEFVTQTGYLSVAERTLNPDDYPDVPAEMLEPGSVVFDPPKIKFISENHHALWWRWQKGASWRHPEGPQSDLRGREKFPVVQVAYEDAEAYAQWKGKRLPTEAEWEYAARGGLDRKNYAWGNDFNPHGKFMANTWQGNFPDNDLAEDGFKGLAPVGSFPANAYGLYDMTGNVWQWVSDWYRPDYYQELSQRKISFNPQGPTESFDPDEPSVKKRVLKGGSYLCDDQFCAQYRPGARGKGDVMSGSLQIGFRLVQRDSMIVKNEKLPRNIHGLK